MNGQKYDEKQDFHSLKVSPSQILTNHKNSNFTVEKPAGPTLSSDKVKTASDETHSDIRCTLS